MRNEKKGRTLLLPSLHDVQSKERSREEHALIPNNPELLYEVHQSLGGQDVYATSYVQNQQHYMQRKVKEN